MTTIITSFFIANNCWVTSDPLFHELKYQSNVFLLSQTLVPSTLPITTQQRTTVRPTTQQQTTAAPTTQQQTTAAPTTQQQTTVRLTTQQQTTARQTTQQQTTAGSTTTGLPGKTREVYTSFIKLAPVQ